VTGESFFGCPGPFQPSIFYNLPHWDERRDSLPGLVPSHLPMFTTVTTVMTGECVSGFHGLFQPSISTTFKSGMQGEILSGCSGSFQPSVSTTFYSRMKERALVAVPVHCNLQFSTTFTTGMTGELSDFPGSLLTFHFLQPSPLG
jgi:hypothetical protein